MDQFDLEKLIPADHLARGIWALVESLETKGFLKENKSVEGHAGRPRTSPRMLLAIWVYSYSQGIGQAREIEREMVHEPALRWLAGNAVLSFRTLSDFRVAHGEALRKTCAELLGILGQEGWINLTELTLDGTKIQANAGSSSRRRKPTLQEHIAKAAEVVRELQQAEAATEISRRQAAARKRAAEERHERLKKAAQELEEIRKGKKAAEREEARVSLTDPEARVMKDGHGGYGLSYNVQVLTETKNKIVVDVAVTQQGYDQQQLEPAMERLQEKDQFPERMLVDGGYTSAANLEAAHRQGLDLIGPELDRSKQQARNCAQSLKQAGIAKEFGPSAFVPIEEGQALRCPAGKRMELTQISPTFRQYVSNPSDCAECPHQAQCSPKGRRYVKVRRSHEAVAAYTNKMQEPEYQERYRKRGEVAEFPHAWWKEKLGLRRFHVRGQRKVEIEAWWAALTYNIQQWVRLSWRPKLAAA
jgi:transposase